MEEIMRFTIQADSTTFSPHGPWVRYEAHAKAIADLRAEVERLSWKPITPDSLPKWGDEVGCLDMTAWNVHSVAYIFNPTMRTLSGWTHYRPINPPASTKGEDNAGTK